LVERREVKNVITDLAMDAIGQGTGQPFNLFSTLALGTGSVTGVSAPAVTQTSMSAEISRQPVFAAGSSNTYVDSLTAADGVPYWEQQFVRNFDETMANGTLTEAACFSNTNTVIMANRVAIKDATGSVAPLVKTSDFFLIVTYHFRIYPPSTVITGSLAVSNSAYAWTAIATNTGSSGIWGTDNFGGMFTFLGSWPPIGQAIEFGIPTGTFPNSTNATTGVTASAYITGTYFRDLQYTWSPTTFHPTTGIAAVGIAFAGSQFSGPAFGVFFNPKIPKNDINQFLIGVRFSWSRK
jgi:hypothetical protein